MKSEGQASTPSGALADQKALPWTLKKEAQAAEPFNQGLKIGLEQLYLGLQKKAKAIKSNIPEKK